MISDHPLTYRPKAVAKALGISMATLYRRMAAGDIKTSKFGGARLISHDELVRIASGRVAYEASTTSKSYSNKTVSGRAV